MLPRSSPHASAAARQTTTPPSLPTLLHRLSHPPTRPAWRPCWSWPAAPAQSLRLEFSALLAHGASVHATAPPDHPAWAGMTPLHVAAARGSTALAQLLLWAGARPDVTTQAVTR